MAVGCRDVSKDRKGHLSACRRIVIDRQAFDGSLDPVCNEPIFAAWLCFGVFFTGCKMESKPCGGGWRACLSAWTRLPAEISRTSAVSSICWLFFCYRLLLRHIDTGFPLSSRAPPCVTKNMTWRSRESMIDYITIFIRLYILESLFNSHPVISFGSLNEPDIVRVSKTTERLNERITRCVRPVTSLQHSGPPSWTSQGGGAFHQCSRSHSHCCLKWDINI